MPASSLREEAQATVSNKHGHREEHEVSRKTIARGMPGRSGVTVVTTLVCLFFTHEAAGASRARHSLRPLNLRRRDIDGKTSDASRREDAESCFGNWGNVIARSAATKQSRVLGADALGLSTTVRPLTGNRVA
jgi:hypothetical protein